MAVQVLLLLAVVVLTSQTGVQSQRIWTLHVGHDYLFHSYFDDAGYLKGFGIEMIDLVCKHANMDCRILWDRQENCWQGGEQPAGGMGLLGGWYDACFSWTPTTQRIHVFQFGLPYTKPRVSHFFTRSGNPGGFSPSDLTGKTIGFLSSGGANPACIARQTNIEGNMLTENQIKTYMTTSAVFTALQDRQVDAVFAASDFFSADQKDDLLAFDEELFCYLGGKSVMARTDSDFVQHWNAGFQRIKLNNKWSEFCDKSNKEHAHKGTVNCVD